MYAERAMPQILARADQLGKPERMTPQSRVLAFMSSLRSVALPNKSYLGRDRLVSQTHATKCRKQKYGLSRYLR